jgi:hydrogenase expression/formation protein HypE
MATKSGVGILIREADLPISGTVRAAAEMLGLDPLHIANEGKALLGVRPEAAERVLAAVRGHHAGARATIVGECMAEHPGRLVLDTGLGRRLITEPEGLLLPRIC